MISFGGSSSSQSSKPVQVPMWTPEQQAISNRVYSAIQGGMGNVPSYPGLMYVPQTPEETQYLNLAGTLPGQSDYRLAALNSALSGKPAYDINPQVTSDYFEKSIRPIMEREYRETTLPSVDESYVGPGYYGSARGDARTKLAEHFGEDLSSTKAGLVYQDELARRQALENAMNRQAGVAPQAYEAMMSDVGTAGQYARMIQEQKTLSDVQRWLSGETVDGVTPTQYDPWLEQAMAYLGLRPFAVGQQGSASSMGFNFGFTMPK